MTITTWLPAEEDVAFYREHGWFVAPQVFTDDELDAATEAAWRFYEQPDRRLDHVTGFSNWTPADGFDTVRNNEFVSLQHDAFRAIAWSERIGAIAARLAGCDEIRLLDDQLVYKPPSMPASEVGWHADHAYWGTCSSSNLITAWVPFHDIDEDRATLVVLDGSHRWEGIEHSRHFNDPDLRAYSARWGSERGGVTEVPLRLRKGQVSFHHCWTLHASYANRSDRHRLAMAVHLQDGANTYREAFRPDGQPVHIFDEALCRRLPDGRPDFADPDVFPALWAAERSVLPVSAERPRVGIVGGIFGMPASYRETVKFTPETVLVDHLGDHGIDAVPLTHYDHFDAADFDVVHVHHLSWGAMRAATSTARTPMVFTMHMTTTERGRSARFVMARSDAVVALFPEDAQRLAANYHTAGARMAVIPNGIDPEVFAFADPVAPLATEPWRLLFVGQLIPVKAVDVLLDAIALVRRTHPVELSLSYHSAADEAKLREQAAALAIADIVHFVGAAPQPELSSRYRAAHITVLPSRSEALPSALTEAMLSGCYPVASNVGGIAQQLGPFGVLIDEPRASAVAAAIVRAIETYGEHQTRAAEMRRIAVERFSIASMVNAHASLYRELIAANERPRRLRARSRAGTALMNVPLAVTTRNRRRPEHADTSEHYESKGAALPG